jgi:hypothetical protein
MRNLAERGCCERSNIKHIAAGQVNGADFDSPFEQALANAISRKGYEVSPILPLIFVCTVSGTVSIMSVSV